MLFMFSPAAENVSSETDSRSVLIAPGFIQVLLMVPSSGTQARVARVLSTQATPVHFPNNVHILGALMSEKRCPEDSPKDLAVVLTRVALPSRCRSGRRWWAFLGS